MRILRPAGLSVLLLLAAAYAALAAAPDPLLAQDEKLLRDGHVTPDGPALLAFFRERTLTADQKARLAELVKTLGDDAFEVREKASEDLLKAGRLALPLLKPAVRDPDAEVARRAADCLREIEQGSDLVLAAAAARVLAERKTEGAVEVLLAYLPDAPDESVEEAVVAALGAAGVSDGKANAALVAALKDREASRRAAAALAVGKANAEQRRAVLPLLDDADLRVRLSAATALVRAGDRAAVPALIALVETGAPALAWQAEDVLFRIAGPDAKLPALGAGTDPAGCRRAWDAWWKEKGDKIDLTTVNLEETERGITLVCDVNGSRPGSDGSVWECGRDGKVTWRYDILSGPIDAHLLPGGRLLIAEHRANRVAERDRKGTILWETRTRNSPVACQRLANGNTFIATYDELLEVTRDGKTVWSLNPGRRIFSATKLRNGHVVYAHSNNAVAELDASGREVRSVPCAGTGTWAGVELLPNGHFLVALYGSNKVLEMDAQGKQLWGANVTSPTFPSRLRNGNTLVPSPDGHKVVELDRNGKMVWSASSEGSARPFRARRY
jgi:HEAT repeat protein